jgi:ParB-like chromosome segregation protein Spo0J
MQPVLFMEDDKAKIILNVPVGSCEVSPFNPRRTRADVDIDSLARRMERNGFEITRALWVYQAGDRYMVFAGGNRLLAVQRTTIATVPVVLHKGYTDEEIVGLADQDNGNDEYHRPVPLVDVWMDYKRLADMWGKGHGQRIAKAKGVSPGIVSERLQYALWSVALHEIFKSQTLTEAHARELLRLSNFEDFGTNDFLREGHAREIQELVQCTNLTPWLDRGTCHCFVAYTDRCRALLSVGLA